ncbi:pyridoxamine 5'-phosphate oxidase [Hydrogenophaga crassostreae]|uniref:Pyridoxamine 5'-phosphate oxidase n=1 Tax=Hydrogenophaga crassostreae TaxID=1763535 RepID=A0A162VUX4_9BURK|nr:pyridoxamine 5'-phosphate oxidase family protein [Hydrogenophaga crassostreae]AOW12619.1 pyridoxamine 5'-phosphate oxidase [Hydrogenophaga crassostreae]OAD40489.1 pyridoxamine 5'-phosphate oxidase [Hydrogenophaga crassostreae]
MASENGLTRALSDLFASQRTGALGTLSSDGDAFVSRVPFAIETETASLVIHVSALASHTGNLLRHPRASLMISRAETAGEPVHALPRVTIDVQAEAFDSNSADIQHLRSSYLARFPEAEPMTQLGDFRFIRLRPLRARQVAGFGAARNISVETLAQAMGAAI